MWSVVEYTETLLRNPATLLGLAVTLLLSVLQTLPIARRRGWSTFGTGRAMVGFGETNPEELAHEIMGVDHASEE